MRILNCYMANDSKGHFVTAYETTITQSAWRRLFWPVL